MKQVGKILSASVVMGLIALTACGKSGGGGGGSANTPAACVYDSQGNCVAGVGGTGYIGDGQWNGRLVVNSMPNFQQFAYDNGLCAGQDCAYISGYLNVGIQLQTGGCLPGPANFSISTFAQGFQGQTLSRRGDAYINGSNNGFMLNYTSQPNYYSYAGAQNGGLGSMQINTQFVDAQHSVLNVQIVYRGQQIASGQIFGRATYNPSANVAGVNYCAGGFGGGGMPYQGNGGFMGGYAGYPGYTNYNPGYSYGSPYVFYSRRF